MNRRAAHPRMRAVPGASPDGTTEMIKRALLFARRLPADLLPWPCGMAVRAVSGRGDGRRASWPGVGRASPTANSPATERTPTVRHQRCFVAIATFDRSDEHDQSGVSLLTGNG